MQQELKAVAANLAMNNPGLLHSTWGERPGRGSPEAPLLSPVPADVKRACLHLLVGSPVTLICGLRGAAVQNDVHVHSLGWN